MFEVVHSSLLLFFSGVVFVFETTTLALVVLRLCLWVGFGVRSSLTKRHKLIFFVLPTCVTHSRTACNNPAYVFLLQVYFKSVSLFSTTRNDFFLCKVI